MAKKKGRGKHVSFPVSVKPSKKPIIKEPLIEDYPLSWRFSNCDKDGPFAWNFDDPKKLFLIMDNLHHYEMREWHEVIADKSHPIEISHLNKTAQQRLQVIGRDDLDELISFRITGENRLWCFRYPNNMHIMRVLWWDEHHKVCPAEKDKADRAKRRRRR